MCNHRALVAGLVLMAGCSGPESKRADSSSSASSSTPPSTAVASSGEVDGATVYQRCATCHQATGEGLPGTYPPLAGSEWVKAADPRAAIRIILHGLQGSVTVKGQTFNSAMPPYGTAMPLSDAEIAAVLSYVRSSWGNSAAAVTADVVARERAATSSQQGMWSADELRGLLK